MIITYILLHEINNTAELFLLDNIRRQLRGKIILIMIIIISMKEGKGVYQHISRNHTPPSFILISYLLMSSFLGLIRASSHWDKYKVFSYLSPHFRGCNSTAPGQGDTWTILSIFGLQHGIPLGNGVGVVLSPQAQPKTQNPRKKEWQDSGRCLCPDLGKPRPLSPQSRRSSYLDSESGMSPLGRMHFCFSLQRTSWHSLG